MNLINELESELAFAVLIEKKHSEKINSEDVLPLIKRINNVLESALTKENMTNAISLIPARANHTAH